MCWGMQGFWDRVPRRCLGVLIVVMLTGCVVPGWQTASNTAPTSLVPTPPQTQTSVPDVHPTTTLFPTPTPYPTPLPTLVIPMLTHTAPLDTTPEPTPDQWLLPERIIPDPFGVEIHFTRASQQELDYLAAGGFKWVRMDLFWHTIEKEPGRYDFSEYDVLVHAMQQRGIRVILILDYGNPLYDQGFPPASSGGQEAFARFAAAAARRYHGAGVVWDLWNEPNLDHFWPPESNATQYGQLALEAIAAIRRVDPTALIVGPALCGYEWPYWHTLGKMGLFSKVDAVTVHAYGVTDPESLIGPHLHLRSLLTSYHPHWKVPILSGEWGFPTTKDGLSETQQAQYLVRQWLFNLSHDIHLSIWYDWRDDGTDPHDPEQNFGTVRHDYAAKPAYHAARTLATTLEGYRFLRRIPVGRAEDYLLLFQNENRVALAAWTTAPPHSLDLPLSVVEVDVTEMTGEKIVLSGDGERLTIGVSPSPRYLHFRPDQAPAYLGGWQPASTINTLARDGDATVPVLFEPYATLPRYGELQVWVDGKLRGSTRVDVPAMARQAVSVPVDLGGLTGNVAAELRLVLDNDTLAPLQSATIWLQVVDGTGR